LESGGVIRYDNDLFIGPPTAVRGRPSLYLPTDDCDSLTNNEINQVNFLW